MGIKDQAKAAAEATAGKLEEAYGRANDNPEAKKEGEEKQIDAAAEDQKEQAKHDIKEIPD
ncbi:MAG: CsbD family protein [Phormidesmis sp.]